VSTPHESINPNQDPAPSERLHVDVEQLKQEQARMRRDARASGERVLQGIRDLGEGLAEQGQILTGMCSTVDEYADLTRRMVVLAGHLQESSLLQQQTNLRLQQAIHRLDRDLSAHISSQDQDDAHRDASSQQHQQATEQRFDHIESRLDTVERKLAS
jgi:hypothetical protein